MSPPSRRRARRGEAFGVTFAAVRDGAAAVERRRRPRARRGDAAGGDDPLVIGSVTKTFVSATILQLVEEGRLRLDDRLSDLPAGPADRHARHHHPRSCSTTPAGSPTCSTTPPRPGSSSILSTRGPRTSCSPRSMRRGTGRARATRTPTPTTTCSACVIEKLTGRPWPTSSSVASSRRSASQRTRVLTGAADDGRRRSSRRGPRIFWASGSMASPRPTWRAGATPSTATPS